MFVFNVANIISYNEYIDYIANLKASFDLKKARLFAHYDITTNAAWNNDTERYTEFRRIYRALRQDVIEQVLSKFRQFLPEKCLIYQFGSLIKFTDRIESDIDLTICYDVEKTEMFECVEELIDYSIVYVFENSIDHIHGKFQHYPNIHDYDALTEKDNLYLLRFNHGAIEYKCGPETLSENLMNIKNVRDYGSLLDGYKEKYTRRCNIDCLYSIQILENTAGHDFISDLAELEAHNDIFLNFHYARKTYAFSDIVEISEIKKAFKETIVAMYIMICYLRKRVHWLNQYSMTMDDVLHSKVLRSLLGDDYIDSLNNSLMKMIFFWDKIELLLKSNGVLLSTRCHKIFQKQKLDEMLYQKYNELNFMDKIWRSINELSNIVEAGWRLIDDKFHRN